MTDQWNLMEDDASPEISTNPLHIIIFVSLVFPPQMCNLWRKSTLLEAVVRGPFGQFRHRQRKFLFFFWRLEHRQLRFRKMENTPSIIFLDLPESADNYSILLERPCHRTRFERKIVEKMMFFAIN